MKNRLSLLLESHWDSSCWQKSVDKDVSVEIKHFITKHLGKRNGQACPWKWILFHEIGQWTGNLSIVASLVILRHIARIF